MCTGINISRQYTYPGDHDTATMFDVCERLLPHRANVVYDTILDRITFLALISHRLKKGVSVSVFVTVI